LFTRLVDPAHTNNSDGFARNMHAQKLSWPPAKPISRTHHTFTLTGSAASNQHQSKSNISGGCDRPRAIGHTDPSTTGRCDVNMIDVHTKIGHQFARCIVQASKYKGRKIITKYGKYRVILAIAACASSAIIRELLWRRVASNLVSTSRTTSKSVSRLIKTRIKTIFHR
jgi:hypothetical protein